MHGGVWMCREKWGVGKVENLDEKLGQMRTGTQVGDARTWMSLRRAVYKRVSVS